MHENLIPTKVSGALTRIIFITKKGAPDIDGINWRTGKFHTAGRKVAPDSHTCMACANPYSRPKIGASQLNMLSLGPKEPSGGPAARRCLLGLIEAEMESILPQLVL